MHGSYQNLHYNALRVCSIKMTCEISIYIIMCTLAYKSSIISGGIPLCRALLPKMLWSTEINFFSHGHSVWKLWRISFCVFEIWKNNLAILLIMAPDSGRTTEKKCVWIFVYFKTFLQKDLNKQKNEENQKEHLDPETKCGVVNVFWCFHWLQWTLITC